MIDIHSHILPGIDDGAKTEADSIAMAKQAVEQGIHTVIATPHHKNGHYENVRDNILKYTHILNDLFKTENIPLTLLPGQETRINGEMIEDLKDGNLLPLNDSMYLFVELPSASVPRYTSQILYDIQMAGHIPIIVHPERNRELIENPNLLYELVSKGALTQVTAGSIIGKFGKKIATFTHELIEANLTHFIASDAHNTTSRQFNLQPALETIQTKYGIDTYFMFHENSQLLIDGMNVNKMEPQRIKKKRFFGLF